MYAAITPIEVLAIGQIKQWAMDRAALRGGKTASYKYAGKQTTNSTRHDARLVRCIDFERALSRLTEEEQAVLLSTYRTGNLHHDTAAVLGCSTRKVCYLLPSARKHLANVLDSLDLL